MKTWVIFSKQEGFGSLKPQATVPLILQNGVYLALISLEHFPKACVKPVVMSDYPQYISGHLPHSHNYKSS